MSLLLHKSEAGGFYPSALIDQSFFIKTMCWNACKYVLISASMNVNFQLSKVRLQHLKVHQMFPVVQLCLLLSLLVLIHAPTGSFCCIV